MASFDEVFKRPRGSSGKRKLEAIRDPAELYKAAKIIHRTRQEPDAHPASVSDGPDSGGAASPDVSDRSDDDFEGRLFGGGVSQLEEQMLDLVEQHDHDGLAAEPIDEAWLKKAVLALSRTVAKNAELRDKFEHDPQQFIGSEADLDSQIKELAVLSEYPQLLDSFVRLGCPRILIDLLSHENTDIAIDVVELVVELNSDEVATDLRHRLVDAFLDANLIELLVATLSRLNEQDESDRNGVYHVLSLLESLCYRTAIADRLCQHPKLPPWLLDRCRTPESPVSENKQYATEILAILAQASVENRRRLITIDATDSLLQLVAAYRSSDPERTSNEEEYMQGLFDVLTCLVDEPEGKAKFLEAEGTALCIIMLREGHMSLQPALRLLDHAVDGALAADVCQSLVELGGLKPLFKMFMKKSNQRTFRHLLEIFSSLLRSLPADCPERIRTLAKFMENDYEKTARLTRLRTDYAELVVEEEERIVEERKWTRWTAEELVDLELQWHNQRMEAGLFMQHKIELILAWLAAEDDGARRHISPLIGDIRQSLVDQQRYIADDEPDGQDRRDMMSALIDALE